MIVNISPDLTDTKDILTGILGVCLADSAKASFVVPFGMGETFIKRIRVQMSRKKLSLARSRVRVKPFRLCSEVVVESINDSDRVDRVTFWAEQTMTHRVDDMLNEIEKGTHSV